MQSLPRGMRGELRWHSCGRWLMFGPQPVKRCLTIFGANQAARRRQKPLDRLRAWHLSNGWSQE